MKEDHCYLGESEEWIIRRPLRQDLWYRIKSAFAVLFNRAEAVWGDGEDEAIAMKRHGGDETEELNRLLTELDELKARLVVVHRRLRELGFDARTMPDKVEAV